MLGPWAKSCKASPNSKLRLEKQLKEQKEIEVGKRACGFHGKIWRSAEVEGTFRGQCALTGCRAARCGRLQLPFVQQTVPFNIFEVAGEKKGVYGRFQAPTSRIDLAQYFLRCGSRAARPAPLLRAEGGCAVQGPQLQSVQSADAARVSCSSRRMAALGSLLCWGPTIAHGCNCQ